MTPTELVEHFKQDANLEIVEIEYEGEIGLGFRDESLPYFENNPDMCEFVSCKTLEALSLQELKDKLFNGLDIRGIARVTGYFSTVQGWNKGKLQELRDRARAENAAFLPEASGAVTTPLSKPPSDS